MKRVSFLVTLLLLAVPAAAWAGSAPAAAPDTSGATPRRLQLSIEVGMSWMEAPQVVSNRYAAGLALGGSVAAAPASRLRVAVQGEYLDLPNGAHGYLGLYELSNGQASTLPIANFEAFHGGYTADGLAVLSVRTWRDLWLDGGAGVGYFSSGYPNIQFIDGVTGESIRIPGETGWGPAYAAGLAYEFTVGKRQRLFASVRWTRLDRGPEQLDLVPVRLGLRFD